MSKASFFDRFKKVVQYVAPKVNLLEAALTPEQVDETLRTPDGQQLKQDVKFDIFSGEAKFLQRWNIEGLDDDIEALVDQAAVLLSKAGVLYAGRQLHLAQAQPEDVPNITEPTPDDGSRNTYA